MNEEMKTLSVLLPVIYPDLAQPAARNVGRALGSVVELVTYPVERSIEIVLKKMDKFFDKMEAEQQDNIVPADPNIAVPILQKLTYTEEDELVDLYTELLKKNCLKDSKDKVLPSYVNMIANLTSDEARIIDFLFKKKYTALVPYYSAADHYHPDDLALFERVQNKSLGIPLPVNVPLNDLPFLEVRNQHKSRDQWKSEINYFTDISNRIHLLQPKNIELYFDNLKAIGVLEKIRDDALISPAEVYNHLEEKDEILNLKAAIEKENRKMVLIKRGIGFTHLGTSFLEACTATTKQ